MMYIRAVTQWKYPAATIAKVRAGFRWPPEICWVPYTGPNEEKFRSSGLRAIVKLDSYDSVVEDFISDASQSRVTLAEEVVIRNIRSTP